MASLSTRVRPTTAREPSRVGLLLDLLGGLGHPQPNSGSDHFPRWRQRLGRESPASLGNPVQVVVVCPRSCLLAEIVNHLRSLPNTPDVARGVLSDEVFSIRKHPFFARKVVCRSVVYPSLSEPGQCTATEIRPIRTFIACIRASGDDQPGASARSRWIHG